MMISMSVVHSLSISSLRRITNSVHYGWFKTWIYSIVTQSAQITYFMMTLMSVGHSKSPFVRTPWEKSLTAVL